MSDNNPILVIFSLVLSDKDSIFDSTLIHGIMEKQYRYFNRDISWLSFNHRVLLEADDDDLPLYERINFIAIYSSNLEEFYKVRVAEHKVVASGGKSEDMTVDQAHELIRKIAEIVNAQLEDRIISRKGKWKIFTVILYIAFSWRKYFLTCNR